MLILTSAVLLIGLANPVAAPEDRLAATERLATTLAEVGEVDDDSQRRQLLRTAAAEVAQSLGAWSEAGNLLQEALANSEKDDSARPLLKAIAAANRLLSFEPLNEAPMPDGFPATTPAGEIQLKDYPAYRLARTKMGRTDMGAFLTLFRHIKQNDIAMTAPVEMTYPRRTDENEVIGETTMAFLYGSDVGKDTQAEEGVDIVEVAPLQVVSIGNIGRRTNSRVVWAKNRLEAWLAEVRPDLEIVGGLRVLGYNGPSVPTSKQYFEVQFEVRPSTIRGSF